MASIYTDALPLLIEFAPVFTQPTFRRVQLLVVAAVLTTGRRTIANLLRTLGVLVPGQASTYHRLLSQARWSGLQLAARLLRLLLRHFGGDTIRLVGDDTVDEHRGKKVYGKARPRDAVRSSQADTSFRSGHKWVVLALLVTFPFASRPWALPVLIALYHSPAENRRRGRPQTVLRAAPCLLGLYTLVSVWYWQLPASVKEDWGVLWTGKEAVTFSDAITAVRRWLWSDWFFATSGHDVAFAKLSNALQEVLLTALTPAA